MSEAKRTSPTLSDFPEETLCPSCGKFVGAYARCPYCGTAHTRRMSIRFFRIFSICMAFGGVFLIWLAARGIQAPLIKIEDIQPTNAFAYVRVEGKDTRTKLHPDGGISFWIDDGTGTLMVRAYREIGQELRELGRVPAPGDRVTAEGTLQLREDFVQMIVNIPEKITIEPASTDLVAIANLGPPHLGEKVMVEGKILGERKFPKGSKISLSDGTGTIDVVIWDTNRNAFGEKEKLLKAGKKVSIKGQLGQYQNILQISLDFPVDIKELGREIGLPETILPPAPAKEFQTLDIEEVTRDKLNQFVEITGQIAELRKFSKGRKLQIADPTGSVELLIWDSLYDRLPGAGDLIKEGNLLRIKGKVGEYRGQIQVVPKSPDHVEKADSGG